jgi:hypothetical protein
MSTIDKILIVNEFQADIIFYDKAPVTLSSGDVPIRDFLIWFMSNSNKVTPIEFARLRKNSTENTVFLAKVS